MQYERVPKTYNAVGHIRAKHKAVLCWSLQMNKALELFAIVEPIHCILAAPIGVSLTPRQLEKDLPLRYLAHHLYLSLSPPFMTGGGGENQSDNRRLKVVGCKFRVASHAPLIAREGN